MDPPEMVIGRGVTPNFFEVLAVPPVVGRAFTEAENSTGAPVVVISYGLWQRRYGGDRSIVGRTLLMNDNRNEVIGVMPRGFVFRNREIERDDMRRVADALRREYPGTNTNVGATVVPVKEDALGNTRVELLVLMGAAAAVLSIACANLASLLLSRAVAVASSLCARRSVRRGRA